MTTIATPLFLPANDNAARIEAAGHTVPQGPVPALCPPKGHSPSHPFNPAILGIGETMETPLWRLHRSPHSLKLTRIANAGKRGKRCEEFCIYELDLSRRTSLAELATLQLMGLVRNNDPLECVVKQVALIAEEAGSAPVETHSHRGVDVLKAGAKLSIRTKFVSIEADTLSFCVQCLVDERNEPTAISAKRTDAGRFFNWARLRDFGELRYREVLAAMRTEGIGYHDYCAID